MNKEGRLNEKTIREAASAGDREFIIAALSICSGENHEAVNRIFEMRSTKGIVAICWKAEFSMDSAVLLQATVGAIAPAMILKPESGANYPMTEEEMLWRLEFFEADI
jgi:hypothetical protein